MFAGAAIGILLLRAGLALPLLVSGTCIVITTAVWVANIR